MFRPQHGAGAARAMLALLLVSGLASCRKPPPRENVFTGQAKPTTTTIPTVSPPPAQLPPEPPPPSEAFSKANLLRASADCALRHVKDFEAKAQALKVAARAHVADASPAQSAQTKDAWREAAASFQLLELHRLGPLARAAEPGGKGLRDELSAWPLVNRCMVDEQLVATSYLAPTFSTSVVSARGVGVVEYLLFAAGTGNACTSVSTINASGSWAALSPSILAGRRIAYAAASADVIAERALELLAAWDPARGNFHRELSLAGNGSAVYAREQDGLNAISNALFYLDVEVKDLKVGRPVGLVDCFTATCPEALEAPYARASLSHLRQNLLGFRKVFQGCADDGSGFGFDDWLRAAGAGGVADRMFVALATAEATAASLEPSMEDVLGADAKRVVQLHTDIKALTDLLKTEFVTVLNLELPKSSEGDND